MTGPIFYAGARIPIPSAEFVVAAINACADIPLEALKTCDPKLVRDVVMDHYRPDGADKVE